MNNLSIGFIGLGLIGGSIAKGIKSLHPNYNIIAFSHNANTISKGLLLAKDERVVDSICTDLKKDFACCDIIFLCAPVLENIAYLEKLKSVIKPTCILTDVGSVKGNIHKAVHELALEKNFIGGHPMAGSEKTGYENASLRLLENAYYILTPTKSTPDFMIQTMLNIVTEIGALPMLLKPEEHDDITAAISHIPHIIAASLVNLVRENDNEEESMRVLAAGGFKDITRIASSSSVMWQNICLSNPESILKFLNEFMRQLTHMATLIKTADSQDILTFFEEACEYRNSLPAKTSGILQRSFELYIDVADEAGAIASIATILAKNDVSIKNIGILHNREFEEGVLRLELYDEASSFKSATLLEQCGYTIYQREKKGR